MRIVNLRPPDSGGPPTLLARFEVHFSEDLQLLGWELRRSSAGKVRVFPPRLQKNGAPTAIVSSAIMSEIAAAATEIFNYQGGHFAHGIHHIAA